MSEKLYWQKSGNLPEPFSWLASGDWRRPTIWASKREDGIWFVQFAYKQYGHTSTGKTRNEAAANVLSQWEAAGKQSVYA